MLLYDRMMKLADDDRRIAKAAQHTRNQIESMRNAQVIVIDNVARYMYEDSSQEYWSENDFPNVAPPFGEFWLEYKHPKYSNSEGKIIKFSKWFSDSVTGVLLKGWKVEDMPSETRKQALLLDANAKWSLTMILFMGIGDDVVERGAASLLIDNEGKIIAKSKMVHVARDKVSQIPNMDDFKHDIYSSLDPCFLALSFMHCKNVTIRKQVIPKGLIKKAQKKHNYIPIRYHILDIEPMKKVLRYEGNAEKTGLKMALHICRGHFKDYSKGDGLFRKYKGLYWWDSHLRGSIEEGVVAKDYNVNPPSPPKQKS